jgi:hypothetical protein
MDEFPATIRTEEIHLFGAFPTKRAFVAANPSFAFGTQSASTLLALFFHFQGH